MRKEVSCTVALFSCFATCASASEDATAWGINTRIETGYMCKKRCTPEDISEKRVAQVTVVEVACGSPADVAGVKVGDSIRQINEVHVFGATFESYQTARGGESAVSVKPVRVSIERGEKYHPERLMVTVVPAVLTRPIDWTCGK